MRPKYSFFAYNIEDEAVKLVKKKTKKNPAGYSRALQMRDTILKW